MCVPHDVERTGILYCGLKLLVYQALATSVSGLKLQVYEALRTCMPQDVERTGMLRYAALSYSKLIGEPENIRTESAYKDVAQR